MICTILVLAHVLLSGFGIAKSANDSAEERFQDARGSRSYTEPKCQEVERTTSMEGGLLEPVVEVPGSPAADKKIDEKHLQDLARDEDEKKEAHENEDEGKKIRIVCDTLRQREIQTIALEFILNKFL